MATNILDPELLLKLASQQPEGVAPGWYVGADGRYYKSGQANVDAPDAVRQVMDSFERPYDPSAQNFDPNLVSNLVWKEPVVTGSPNQTWSGSDNGTVTIPKDYDLNTGYIIGSPGDVEVRQGKRQPYTETPKQVSPSATNAQPQAQSPTATQSQGQQPQKNDLESGYENYLKLFEKTLGDKPELDTKRRNQLAMVAGINALGQALKQVVDFTGREKFGSPINPQQDNLTPALLAQYEKEMQDYEQRRDRYDLQRTNTMQQALQYAYGDEKAREQYEKQLDLLGRQQAFSGQQSDEEMKFRAEENEKERKARAELYGTQAAQQAEQAKTQQGYDLEKLQKNYEYESSLAAQRANDALKAVKEKYGFQAATKAATELAKKSLLVTDEDPNKPITIPPQIYLDVLQKQIALQNQDFTEFLTSTDFNATNNAGDIMVARYWKDFYNPVYDANGDVISWETKGAKYEPQPQATPGGDSTPEWLKY